MTTIDSIIAKVGNAEEVAHAMLEIVADFPGHFGRLRIARLVGGFPVPHRDGEDAETFRKYVATNEWTLRQVADLIDALLEGGLVAHTPGPRPTVVLTRGGWRALEALTLVPPAPAMPNVAAVADVTIDPIHTTPEGATR